MSNTTPQILGRQSPVADSRRTQRIQLKRPREQFIDTRFRFASIASQTKKLKFSLSDAVSSSQSFSLESEKKDRHECHFTSALQAASLENTSIPFKVFYKKIQPLSRSLPLLIYHKEAIVRGCCAALIVEELDHSQPDMELRSKSTGLSRRRKNQLVTEEKEKSTQLRKAKERVDLVAHTILDLLVPLIVDLSTALLQPSTSPEKVNQCCFEDLLTTLIYFINIPGVNPIALTKATEVIIHLFKTLAKDLTSSSDPGRNEVQLRRLWHLVRVALGAPFSCLPDPKQQGQALAIAETFELESEEDTIEDGMDGDLTSEVDLDQTRDITNINESPVEFNGEEPDCRDVHSLEPVVEGIALVDTPEPICSPLPTSDSRDPDASQLALVQATLNSTTPATRKLLASALSFLVRRKGMSDQLIRLMFEDLHEVELQEMSVHGCLKQRKQKERNPRPGKGQQNLVGEEKGGAKVFAEGICCTLVESCKSVDHRLHSRASTIILEIDTELVAFTRSGRVQGPAKPLLMRRVLSCILIAILHHSTAEHCGELLAALAARTMQRLQLMKTTQLSDGNDGVKDDIIIGLEISLECLSVAAGLRQGSRLSPSSKERFFRVLFDIVDTSSSTKLSCHDSVVPIIGSFMLNLLASTQDSSDFFKSSAFRTAIDAIFVATDTVIPLEHVYHLASSLCALQWPFFAGFVLPNLYSVVHAKLSNVQRNREAGLIACFLSNLAHVDSFQIPQQLAVVIAPKIDQAIKSISFHLSFITLSTDSSEQSPVAAEPEIMSVQESFDWMDLYISLAPQLASMINVQVIDQWIQRELSTTFHLKAGNAMIRGNYISDYQSGVVLNWTMLMSKMLQLIHCTSQCRGEVTKVFVHVPAILANWGWHRNVLQVVQEICEDAKDSGADVSFTAFTGCYQCLKAALLSESDIIRHLVLKILLALSPGDSVLQKILQQCLKIEKTPLLVDSSRERQMHIRKLGILVKSNEELTNQPLGLDLAQRYLLAQLKVNFKPLWEESIKSLTLINEKCHVNFWQVTWSQLALTLNKSSDLHFSPPTQLDESVGNDHNVFPPGKFSDHPQFTCTNLERLISHWSSDPRTRSLRRAISVQQLHSRLDLKNYEAQLLNLLCQNPTVAQKHNKPIIDAFFEFCQADEIDLVQGHLLGRSARTRLIHWLPLFAKLTNPRSLYRSEELRGTFFDLLADPDLNLRRLSLECILIWKDGGIIRHQDSLRDLMDPSKLREALLKLSLSYDGDQITDHDRHEVMPLAIRLLYGSMLMNQGRSSSKGNTSRKSAILTALKGCSLDELDLLINLMVKPLSSSEKNSDSSTCAFKKQLGFLTLLGDIIKFLGRDIIHRWDDLINLTVAILISNTSALPASTPTRSRDVFLDTQSKRVRTQVIHRLNGFFKNAPNDFSFDPWIKRIFDLLITPKLPVFASESAQAPSALLELFFTWSSRPELMHHLVNHDSKVLHSVYQTLAIPNVKSPVVERILDILEHVLRNIASDPSLTAEVYLQPYFQALLPSLAELLRKSSASFSLATSTSRRKLSLLSALAPFVTEPEHTESFCELLLPLLLKGQIVDREHIQAELLVILADFLKISPRIASSSSTVQTIAKLFEIVMNRKGRYLLNKIMDAISIHSNGKISLDLVELLNNLNSFSVKRIDEADFERRLTAFAKLNEELYSRLDAIEWTFVIHHALFQIRDPEELSLRSSSALTLCRFFEVVEVTTDASIRKVLTTIMMPGLKKALRSKLQIIRQEVLSVFSAAVERNVPDVVELAEMRCLLVGGDREANFFLNIYHIQAHRRTRALRRLADESEVHHLSSKVLIDVFFPLLVHLLTGSDSSKSDPDIVNEAIRTLGRVSKVMSWSAYNTVLQTFVKLIHKPESLNKITVRAVVSILKSFHFSLYSDPDLHELQELTGAPPHTCESISAKLIPTLIRFMEAEDDGPDASLRIMVSEGIAFVATFLPTYASQTAISAIVASLSNILKSSHQETRQFAKGAMSNIAAMLPPSFLTIMLKELKAVLTRGPHLHVLAHVVHATISKMSEEEGYQVTQGAIKPLLEIIVDDVFGQPSKDRQSKELKAKTRFSETKTCRSMETLQMLISGLPDADQFLQVLLNFRQLLETTRSPKALKQVDACFHRVCAGVVHNKKVFTPPTVLTLVQNLISNNIEFLKHTSSRKPAYKIVPTDHRVVLSVKSRVADGCYADNAHHFVSLGLDLFNVVYRRAGFDLHSPEYLGMIDPLVNLVGNTLYTHNSEVLARGLKVMGILIKLPLPAIEKSANVIVRQMLAVVSHIGTSESELSQIALKTLASVVRDCKNVDLTEKQLTGLLNIIVPDLEDPERQMTLFALLKGIMSKKFMAPEMYDLMDRIAQLLVTAQAENVREICRSVYLQFLLDYPQGKGRLAHSLQFLLKNLSYEHESGRQSVLEIINAINVKFGVDLVSKNSDLFVMSLVMSVANETSAKCKEMAIEVLKVIFQRIEADKSDKYVRMLMEWSQATGGPKALKRTAVQLLAIYTEIKGTGDSLNLQKIHRSLCSMVHELSQLLINAEEKTEESEEVTLGTLDWELTYQCLQALSKVYKISPSLILSSRPRNKFQEWEAIQSLMLFPHAWVRSSSARLIGSLLSQGANEQCAPFTTINLVSIAKKSTLQLRSKQLDESLALQIVKNMFYVLKSLRDRLGEGSNLGVVNKKLNTTRLSDSAARAAQYVSVATETQVDEEEASDADEETECPGLHLIYLVKRLSRQASIAHAKRPSVFAADTIKWSIEAASVLRCFAALVNHLSVSDLQGIVVPIMVPIFRINEDPNIKDPQMIELQSLAKEVQDFLREKIGSTQFSQVYGQLRAVAMQKRQERKKAIALKAVNHPELNSKRKASRADAKLRNKKRKQASFAQRNARHGKFKRSLLV